MQSDRPTDPAPIYAPGSPSGTAALWLLVAALLLPEALLLGADLGFWGSGRWRPLAYAYGGFWTGLLRGWQPNFPAQPWTMFLTYSFLHAGPMHLIGNLAALAWLARLMQPRIGTGRMLLVYAVAALAGAAMFGLLSRQVAPMVGASGAIFGLAGAWIVGEARDDHARGRPWRQVLGRAALIGLVLAVLNLVQWWAEAGRLAWQTHLGGFLAGAVLASLMPRRRR